MPLLVSIAVARQKSVTLIGRSLAGMSPVSLIPSVAVALTMRDVNVDVVAISKRYVIAPVGPLRAAFVTRSAGRGVVVVPLNGPIGTGALTTTAGPIVNLYVVLNGPVVPPAVARACQ